MCTHVYAYIYIYMFIHTYIYIYIYIQLPAAHPPRCLPASPWTPLGLLWASFGALGTLSESSRDPLWAPLAALWRPREFLERPK